MSVGEQIGDIYIVHCTLHTALILEIDLYRTSLCIHDLFLHFLAAGSDDVNIVDVLDPYTVS